MTTHDDMCECDHPRSRHLHETDSDAPDLVEGECQDCHCTGILLVEVPEDRGPELRNWTTEGQFDEIQSLAERIFVALVAKATEDADGYSPHDHERRRYRSEKLLSADDTAWAAAELFRDRAACRSDNNRRAKVEAEKEQEERRRASLQAPIGDGLTWVAKKSRKGLPLVGQLEEQFANDAKNRRFLSRLLLPQGNRQQVLPWSDATCADFDPAHGVTPLGPWTLHEPIHGPAHST